MPCDACGCAYCEAPEEAEIEGRGAAAGVRGGTRRTHRGAAVVGLLDLVGGVEESVRVRGRRRGEFQTRPVFVPGTFKRTSIYVCSYNSHITDAEYSRKLEIRKNHHLFVMPIGYD
jgi:hypothetical protein